jgi:hypothetical protein
MEPSSEADSPQKPGNPVEHSEADLSQTDVWQVLERIWAGQRARGYVPRTHQQINAALEEARQEDEERMRSLEQIQEEGYRRRYPQEAAEAE